MSFPKIILSGGFVLFLVIGSTAIYKKMVVKVAKVESLETPEVIVKQETVKPEVYQNSIPAPQPYHESFPIGHKLEPIYGEKEYEVDRIYQMFTTGSNKFPIVETLAYSSRVSWLKGRPAWIADYASHYDTSRHFIARSLNGKPDYLTQKVSSGDRFNVLRTDKNFHFYLLVDLSRRKMKFYYVDLDTNERVLIKIYPVGIGRLDERSPSGSLTPIGKYSLGSKIATYKLGTMGVFQDEQTEMIQVFGTRWIPFDQEIGQCSAPPKGYGFHGIPWTYDPEIKEFVERREYIGLYDSDGCIRLYQEDMEELFAILITKPTIVEIVKDFSEADLPGIEVQDPK